MIQSGDDRIGRDFDFAVIDQISLDRIDFAFDHDIEAEGVSMQTPALVIGWKGRQIVGGFKMELLGKANEHPRAIL